ncbi:hypothetical protein [Variovorax sp. Varisp62]|uniref:hypothetical protein n=1 Tax=Variovorax sp. Varisp62 TaxID=3243049 RepID=UPI0039B4AD04
MSRSTSVAPALAAPDAQVAQCAPALEGVQVHAPVQPVAREKVVEEGGAHQFALRHHLRHARGAAARLQHEGDRVVVLVPLRVAIEVGRIHVQRHARVEVAAPGIPYEGGELVRVQQVEQGPAQALADLLLAVVVFRQQRENAAQGVLFSACEVHRRLSRWGRCNAAFRAPCTAPRSRGSRGRLIDDRP